MALINLDTKEPKVSLLPCEFSSIDSSDTSIEIKMGPLKIEGLNRMLSTYNIKTQNPNPSRPKRVRYAINH